MSGAVAAGPRRRLLLINANTDRTITDRLVAAAQRIVPPDVSVLGATARFGARYISTPADYDVAGQAALDAYAAYGNGSDAVLLACFGDPGLAALQERAPVPVLGMADASCRLAAERYRRFSIVTGGKDWPAMLRAFLADRRLAAQVASVRAVESTGGEIAADPGRSHAALARECLAAARDDNAEAVILGGAGLVGVAGAIQEGVPVPVLDGFELALSMAAVTLGR